MVDPSGQSPLGMERCVTLDDTPDLILHLLHERLDFCVCLLRDDERPPALDGAPGPPQCAEFSALDVYVDGRDPAVGRQKHVVQCQHGHVARRCAPLLVATLDEERCPAQLFATPSHTKLET